MNFLFSKFIEKMLGRATYEYDDTVRRWAAWIKGVPGVYAQGRNVEETRSDLASCLEEYLVVSLQEGAVVSGFKMPKKKIRAKAH